MYFVFFTQQYLIRRYSPIYPQIRIIPSQSTFILRSIKVITFILENNFFTQHTETMRKISRYEELTMIFFCKFHCNMLSESRRTVSYIHSNIKNSPLHHTHQFALGKRRFLKMQTANDTVRRFGFIILYEPRLTNFFFKFSLIKGFKKITASIFK